MRAAQEQWSRKVARVADTQTDGKWVVLASSDALHTDQQRSGHTRLGYTPSRLHSSSSLQLYRLYLPSPSNSPSLPKLIFVRTPHGQIGPVSALTLADGRCVSLGVNGSIWVWDLEGGTGLKFLQENRSILMILVCWTFFHSPKGVSCSMNDKSSLLTVEG